MSVLVSCHGAGLDLVTGGWLTCKPAGRAGWPTTGMSRKQLLCWAGFTTCLTQNTAKQIIAILQSYLLGISSHSLEKEVEYEDIYFKKNLLSLFLSKEGNSLKKKKNPANAAIVTMGYDIISPCSGIIQLSLKVTYLETSILLCFSPSNLGCAKLNAYCFHHADWQRTETHKKSCL